jgi:acetyl-CoA synthetase
MNDAQCTMVLTSDGLNRGHKQIPVKRVVDEALEECPSVKKVIVTDRWAGPWTCRKAATCGCTTN